MNDTDRPTDELPVLRDIVQPGGTPGRPASAPSGGKAAPALSDEQITEIAQCVINEHQDELQHVIESAIRKVLADRSD